MVFLLHTNFYEILYDSFKGVVLTSWYMMIYSIFKFKGT